MLWKQRTCLRAPTVQELAAGLSVQDAAAVHAAVYAELKGVQCATVRGGVVRGGVVATVAVCAGAMGNAGAAMRAAARASLNSLARVALCGGALVMASVCVEAFLQAAAALHAAAHTSSRPSRCRFGKSSAGRPGPAQEFVVMASAGAYGAF